MLSRLTAPGFHIGKCRYIKFLVVGFFGACLDISLFALFHSTFGIHLSLSKVMAVSVSILNNFWLNDRWTFTSGVVARTSVARRCLRFICLCTCGMLLGVGLLGVQVWAFGVNVYVANAIAIAVVSTFNFYMNTCSFGAWPDNGGDKGLRAAR